MISGGKEKQLIKITGLYDEQIKNLDRRCRLLSISCDKLREQIENRDIIIGSLRDGFKGTKKHSEILKAEEYMSDERDEIVSRYDGARSKLDFFENDY